MFLRCLYCFSEDVPERYLDRPCETWDATYENLPVVDTLLWKGNEGLVLDTHGGPLSLEKTKESCLRYPGATGGYCSRKRAFKSPESGNCSLMHKAVLHRWIVEKTGFCTAMRDRNTRSVP